MSRSNSQRNNGVKLPFALQQELGISLNNQNRNGQNGNGRQSVSRKETRRADRQGQRNGRNDSKIHGNNYNSKNGRSSSKRNGNQYSQGDSFGVESDEEEYRHSKITSKIARDLKPVQSTISNATVSRTHVPVLSYSDEDDSVSDATSDNDFGSDIGSLSESDESRASSPGLVLDASSRTFLDAAAEEDARIAKLERMVGRKAKTKDEDSDSMLDFLLDGFHDEHYKDKKRKPEGQEWLEAKRRKAEKSAQIRDSSEESAGEDILDSESARSEDGKDDNVSRECSDQNTKGIDEDFSGFDSEDLDIKQIKTRPKPRENPYVAPGTASSNTAKYVPPSLRHRSQDDQSLEQLKRQIQGQLNKLSEANLVSILTEVEKLYQSNARQDVTTVLIDLLLGSFCNPSALSNTYIILYAGFVAALYKIIGIDFGAQILSRLVERFDVEYESGTGKQALNLISLLANLFIFNVIASTIVYDHIRILLSAFGERNAELLLRVARDCGPQLRSDDPNALREIVRLMQNKSSELTRQGEKLNVRTKVMMDTITDLKNNKVKDATASAGSTGEHITRMRKTLGSLNNRNLKATEPLRITRADLENSDKKGKWWLVGASWKGVDLKAPQSSDPSMTADVNLADGDESQVDFLALAKHYRMNTDVRRSIFVAIMSADDWKDAQMRIMKLRLTSKQEQEIGKVLVRCVRAESNYNAYYALLARQLCQDNRKCRISLQFSLWEFFRLLGADGDAEDDVHSEEEQNLEPNEIVNVAKMFAYLVYHQVLTIGIIKVLDIGFLQEQAMLFVEVFIISIFTQSKDSPEIIQIIFSKAAESPQIVKSLQYFIKKYVKSSDLPSKKEKPKVKEGCRLAIRVLSEISKSDIHLD